ncbi:MAG: hypothetical protein IJ435_09405 [Clostridia bacterium]|nr:hypothetical protein [Clostridia bacterium]
MKMLKAILFSLLIHLYMQIDMLLQIKSYDSNVGISNFLAFTLPIIFAVVVYFIFKTLNKKEFWISVISFVIIYVLFVYLGNSTNYFKWLFNLMKLSVFYDDTYYELGVNAIADGLLHTIGFVVSSAIYLIKNRRTK